MKSLLRHAPQGLAVAVAIAFTAMYFAAALPRLVYPYDLDFLEDSVLMEAVRFANSQPVYIPPNAVFNPHVYMPLYFWLGGLLFKLAGPSLLLLRSLSLAATLATTLAIYWISKRESEKQWIALTGAGLFLAGYAISGYWYELARVDSLFVALTIWGLAFAVYAEGVTHRLILAAVLLALATFTKQTGFAVGASIAIFLLITTGRRAGWFVLVFFALTVAPAMLINKLTGGWFFYHIFYIGTADPTETSRLVSFVKDKIFGVMAGLSLEAILAVILYVRRSGLRALLNQPWFAGITLAVVISGLGRFRVGGNLNNLMPAYTLLCLSPALLFHAAHLPSTDAPPAPSRWPWFEWLTAAVVLAQFALSAYSPASHIPSVAMRRSGDELIHQIAAVDGPVLVMMHPYYAMLAGKVPSTQIATLWYVRHRGELPLPSDFVDRIKTQYYAEIISDGSSFETETALQTLLTTYYVPARSLGYDQAPPTNTGVVVRPSLIYLPRQP